MNIDEIILHHLHVTFKYVILEDLFQICNSGRFIWDSHSFDILIILRVEY